MEVELKLSLDPADNDRLMRHPLVAAHARAPARTAHLLAQYFDTPDLHLMHHGAGLRVRQVDGEWIQTMKAGGSVHSGLHQRNEWEGPVDRAWPQLGRLRKLIKADGNASWLALLDATDLKQRLEMQFQVRVERRTWDLDVDGSAIEMVLDQGEVECHGQHAPINEIELELKHGDPDALFNFALRLLDTIPLHVSNVNKAQRGYALCRQTGTLPVKASDMTLEADDTLADALLAMLANCLAQVQGNEAGVIASDNPESLHQMRVGMRRLRSVLKLLEPVVQAPPALLDDISWLGEQLGQARDWDVLQLSTLKRVLADVPANAGTGPEHNPIHDQEQNQDRAANIKPATSAKSARPGKQSRQGLPGMQDAVLEAVHASRHAAAQALRSQRYTRMLLALGAWMQQLAQQAANPAPGAGTQQAGQQASPASAAAAQQPPQQAAQQAGVQALADPVQQFADRTLRRLHKTMLKRASRLDPDDAHAVHRLRIAGKRSRYALEFFRSLYRPRDARRYLDAMSAIQDELGRHNDLVVAERLLLALQQPYPALASTIAYVRGYLHARQGGDGADLDAIVDTLQALKLP